MALRSVIGRELRRLRHDGRYIGLLVVAPLGAALLLCAILGRGVVRDLPIALCDEDQSPLSRRLARMVEAAPTPTITHRLVSTEEGRSLLRSARVFGVLYIPRGFEEGLRAGRGGDLVWLVSGCNLSANGLLSKDIESCAMALGAELRGGEIPPIGLFPHLLFNPTANYGHYLLPGFLGVMLLLFVLLGTLYSIGEEFYSGSAQSWYRAAEGSLGWALLGKFIPLVLIHFIIAQLYLLLLVWGIGIPFRGSLLLVEVATLLLIFAYQAIGITLSALGNLRLALSIGGGYAVMAFTFSGLTFPLTAFYGWLRPMAWLFPYTPYLKLLINQMVRGAAWSLSLEELAPMLLFLLLPLPILGRLKGLLRGGKITMRE